ncbi:hypothetical protein [Chondrinema litorale]|uniref:hypothetical protein n=1 Tax=Chondrinema litorale TaxID=2994555 RepID=UPI00254380B2|nr:hypothetical protein [Chondrinema litorale]UZR98554.1 hypothetical protein OQ292_31620 [Chondrinema litorale]
MEILIMYFNQKIQEESLRNAFSDILKIAISSIIITDEFDKYNEVFFENENTEIDIIIEMHEMDEGDFRYIFYIYGNINKNLIFWDNLNEDKSALEKQFGLKLLMSLSQILDCEILTGDFPEKPQIKENYPHDWIVVKSRQYFDVKVSADLFIDWNEKTIAPKILN